MSQQIKSAYLFDNGLMMVFDAEGHQIPELQTSLLIAWAEEAKSLGYEINGLIIQVPNQRKVKIFEWEFDGEKGINFEYV